MAEKSKKKEEFKILASKQQNGAIVCETEFDQNRLRTLPIGTPLKITVIKDPRNYAHHKKFFKLLSVAFSYWEPEFKVITDSEQWLLDTYQKSIASFIEPKLNDETAKEAFNEMLETYKENVLFRLEKRRKDRLDYEGMKTLEGFLDYVMKKAGCCDLKPTADGGTIKERWSIAFDKMPQAVFNDVYKRCFGVIWNEVLSGTFESEEELDATLNVLMAFE